MRDETCETCVRELCGKAAYDVAATRLIEAYGPEILRFLRLRLRVEADASDAFSQFCEDVWAGIRHFEWRCPARAWCYTLARNARSRLLRSAHQTNNRRRVSESVAGTVAAIVRTGTAPYLLTDVKNRFRQLRTSLGEEDRLILALHVDQGLSWSELAHRTLGRATREGEGDQAHNRAAIEKEAARLRKRFQLIKQTLRAWAEREGLLEAGP